MYTLYMKRSLTNRRLGYIMYTLDIRRNKMEGKTEAKIQTQDKVKVKSCWWRAILGILIAYIFFAITGGLMFAAWRLQMIATWVGLSVVSLIVLIYAYGWLGHCLTNMDKERNVILRIIGKLFGGIGLFIWPFPLMAYGKNKKSIFLYSFSVPLTLFGIVAIILGALRIQILQLPADLSGFYIAVGVVAIVNALFALSTKKCPRCGCLMGKIDYDTLSFEEEAYSREYSRKAGYVSDGNGNTYDVYEKYDAIHMGYADTCAKTFTCPNCGLKKQKRARTIHSMSNDDPRRNS